MRQTIKDAVRIAGHGQAHAMPITQSFMQVCKSAYSVCAKPVEHEKRNEEGQRAETERPGGRGGQRTKRSHHVYEEEEAKAGR